MVMKGIGPVGFVIYDDGIIRAGRWAPLIEVLQRAERLATSRGTWRCLALPRPLLDGDVGVWTRCLGWLDESDVVALEDCCVFRHRSRRELAVRDGRRLVWVCLTCLRAESATSYVGLSCLRLLRKLKVALLVICEESLVESELWRVPPLGVSSVLVPSILTSWSP